MGDSYLEDNSALSKYKSNIITSLSVNDPNENSIKVNAFKLIEYLENGDFNIDIVDFVPILLAEGFKCELNLFQYDIEIDENNFQGFDDGFLLHRDKFSPKNTKSPLPVISIIYIRDKMHYVTKISTKPLVKSLKYLTSENLHKKSILESISKDDFYSKIAKYFQKSKKRY